MTAPAPPGMAAVLRAPQVLRVLTASLVGRLPLGAAPIILVLFARESMSISAAGLLVGAYSAGVAVGQPVLARTADRWRQPPVLWLAVTVSTAGLLALTARPGLAPAVVAAAAAGVGAPPFEACLRVLWKDLVSDRSVTTAYTLDVTVQELIFIAGPVLATAAVALAGPTGGLVVTASVQAAGTLVFASAPAARRWRGEAAPRHWAGPLRSAGLRVLLVTMVLVGAAIGATTVAVAAYAEVQGSRTWAGWLLAAHATGALVGGLVTARRRSGSGRPGLPGMIAILAASYLPALLTPPLPVMILFLAASGLMLPAVLTGVFVVADRVAPPGTAAESFAWVATAFAVGTAAGAAAAGAVLDTVPAVAAGFALAPLAVLAGAAVVRAGGRLVRA